jgi:undecaprenyl phosphate-alpha-L-ara4FN deformylase
MIGVRVDIDSIRDAQLVPLTLELLKNHRIKATFFVTTGVDESYRNFKNYLNPLQIFSNHAFQRYGMSAFTGLFSKKEVQNTKELNTIHLEGHELGLHGYNHYNWMNNLDGVSAEQIKTWISEGCERFKRVFSHRPACFAAPGFKTTPNFLSALDDFDFNYSSDYMGNKPFYPPFNSSKHKTIQLPVTLSLHDVLKSTASNLKERLKEEYNLLYFHPSDLKIFSESDLDSAFALIRGQNVPVEELKT